MSLATLEDNSNKTEHLYPLPLALLTHLNIIYFTVTLLTS